MSASERHYSVKEVAEKWHYSEETIRRVFRDQPGVLRIGSPETRYKRQKYQMSIPESVLIRVYKERSTK